MKRFWNSMSYQIFGVFGISIVLVISFALLSGRASQLSEAARSQVTAADDMVRNGYILITEFHEYIDVPTTDERDAIKQTVDNLVAETDSLQTAFQQGDEELDSLGFDLEELDAGFADVESSYQQFKLSMDNLLAGDPSDWEDLVISLQVAGENFSATSEQLSTTVETFAQNEGAYNSNIIKINAIAIAAMLVIASVIVTFALRAINRLVTVAQAFAEGNYKARASLNTVNEIALVGSSFNLMAQQIEEVLVELEEQVIVSELARARAEQADMVKSSFLASVSHELRTPLNAIINFSKFVIKGVMGPVTEQQTDALNKVVDSGKHLLSLINDVLDISKIESGSLTLFMEPDIDVGEVIRQTATLTEALLEGKQVEMKLDVDANIPLINADRQRVRQIITNILSNACKFTDEGFIKISAKMQDDTIQISIQDTGAGIAAEDYDLVFESFRQTSTGLRQGKGTGLGMPISKRLAEALGGKLWFESEVGKGSTFYISLPVKSEEKIMAIA